MSRPAAQEVEQTCPVEARYQAAPQEAENIQCWPGIRHEVPSARKTGACQGLVHRYMPRALHSLESPRELA